MRWALATLILIVACDPSPPSPDPSSPPPHAAASVFSREAFAPRAADAGVADLPVPHSADPSALAEILSAAPRSSARAPTAPDGGTAIGADTKIREDAGASEPAATADAKRTPVLRAGKPQIEPDLSGPAVEQAARAELYWPLTQKCRDPSGNILPPEAVQLLFRIDADGYIVPSSIVATPREERFAAAARCMGRELGRIPFRGPPGARGGPHGLKADVPSVD